VRGAALWCFVAASLLSRAAAADCSAPSGCVDAEPLWLSPSAARFAAISDVAVPAACQLLGSATLGFRLRPAVLTVPSPSRDGRDVNLLRHTTDLSLGARWGLGNRLELTALLPAGLYQRGAGIKGITDQSAPAIPIAGLHDPRLGLGFQLIEHGGFGAKLRFEAKLPLGARDTLAGEAAPVASPALALAARHANWFGGAELGLRLRKPAELFGTRVGSQALLAVGVGYQVPGPRLSLSVEAYALPSLIDPGERAYLPAEWLASLSWAPRFLGAWSLGAAGGSGLPLSGEAAGAHFAFGVPAFRALLFARLRG
jgi:hypothetical protein